MKVAVLLQKKQRKQRQNSGRFAAFSVAGFAREPGFLPNTTPRSL
jgi:hypothetical protein